MADDAKGGGEKDAEKKVNWMIRVFFDEPTAKQFQADVAEVFGDFKGKLGEIVSGTPITIGKGFSASVKNLFDEFRTAGTDAIGGFWNAFQKARGLLPAAPGGGEGAKGGGGGKDGCPEVKAAEDCVEGAADAARKARQPIEDLLEPLGDLRKAFKDMAAGGREARDTLAKSFQESSLGQWVKRNRERLAEAREDFAEWRKNTRAQMGEFGNKLAEPFRTLGGKIAAPFRSLGGTIGGAFGKLADNVGDRFKQLRDAAANSRFGQAVTRQIDALRPAFGKITEAGGRAWGSLGKIFSTPIRAIGLQGLMVFLSGVQATLSRAFAELKRFEGSLRALDRTSRKAGQSVGFLRRVAQDVQKEFGMSQVQATEFTNAVARLTSEAGRVDETADAMRNLLNLGAKRGMGTEQTMATLQQAIEGVEAATIKLFDKDPEHLFQEYADKVGKTVEELDEQTKAQLILKEVMQQGAAAQGAYNEYLEKGAGQQQAFKAKTEETAAVLGRALDPARDAFKAAMDWIKAKLFEFLTAGMERIRQFIIGVQLLGVDLGVEFQMIPDRLRLLVAGALDRLADLVEKAGPLLKVFRINVDGVVEGMRGSAQEMGDVARRNMALLEEVRHDLYAETYNEHANAIGGDNSEARPQRPRRRREDDDVSATATASASASASVTVPQEKEPEEDALAKRIQTWAEAHRLGVMNNEERAKAHATEAKLNAMLEAGNLTIEERIRLQGLLNTLSEITAGNEEARLAELAEARQLGVITAEEVREAQDIERRLTAEKAKGNHSIQERIRLQRLLNQAGEITGSNADDSATEAEIRRLQQAQRLGRLNNEDLAKARELQRQIETQLKDQTLTADRRNKLQAQYNRLASVKPPSMAFTSKNVWEAIEQGARNAGQAVRDSFGQAFEMLGNDVTNVGAAFDALWKGIAKGAAQAIADQAKARAQQNIAEGIEATGTGFVRLAKWDVPGATAAFAGAAQHFAAAAAWSVLAGAASSAGNRVAGGGGAAGAPAESRDAGSGVAQGAERRGPEIHIYVDGIDPANPRHQRLTQETLKGVRERYGSDGTVTYARKAS